MSDKPNILFFQLDNVSPGDFGCYGGGMVIGAKTPNIDRFAEDSMMLTNYNTEAQCVPSRSALMTGRHSTRTGCVSVLPGCGLVAWELTIADQLKQLGYRNACLGKWHCGNEPGRYPTDKGFDYWYGIGGTWDEAVWPSDKWFRDAGMKESMVLESTGAGHLEEVKVLDEEVRKNFDLTTLEKGKQWMEDAVAADEPFFLYFNHSNVHFPVLPRDDYVDSSDGGPVSDCIQMVDGDFQQMLDKIDELGIKDNTIVVFAADNGRDTSFHPPGSKGAQGNFRGGYFSTYEGNHRTVCIARWPGKIESGTTSDGMMHIVDWFPTMMNLLDRGDLVPTDRVLDGVDQSAMIRGEQEDSNREHFPMFFDENYVGMRYRNFKILTHKVEDGSQQIQKLAMPHVQNLTVDPDEEMPYNFGTWHTWVLYQVYGPRSVAFQKSLVGDAVPKGAPLDFNPKAKADEARETPILDAIHHFFHGG
jgi:arylsulfatase